MMNVCYNCGAYRADKTILPSGPFAVCPECGHRHPFLQMPLLIVSGASGSGKSTVCQRLVGQLTQAVLLDSDILWRPEFDRPDENYRGYFETWLRMCKNISQSGRPVVLFGAGVGVPENMEPCVERRYFTDLHYLALTCDEEELTARLRARPAWRGSSEPDFMQQHLDFNRWFREKGAQLTPPIELLDTTATTAAESATAVAAWIRSKGDLAQGKNGV